MCKQVFNNTKLCFETQPSQRFLTLEEEQHVMLKHSTLGAHIKNTKKTMCDNYVFEPHIETVTFPSAHPRFCMESQQVG